MSKVKAPEMYEVVVKYDCVIDQETNLPKKNSGQEKIVLRRPLSTEEIKELQSGLYIVTTIGRNPKILRCPANSFPYEKYGLQKKPNYEGDLYVEFWRN